MFVSFDYIIQRLSYGGERTLEGGLSDIERADIRKNAEAFLWDAIKAGKINCTGNLYIRQDNSGFKRELNPLSKEERACAKEFMENKDNILWLRAFRDGKGVYIRFAFKSFDFLPELCPCEATPFLCVDNPVFDKEEADRLLSGKEPICFQFTTDKNQSAETTEAAGNKAFLKENGRLKAELEQRNKTPAVAKAGRPIKFTELPEAIMNFVRKKGYKGKGQDIDFINGVLVLIPKDKQPKSNSTITKAFQRLRKAGKIE